MHEKYICIVEWQILFEVRANVSAVCKTAIFLTLRFYEWKRKKEVKKYWHNHNLPK